MNGYRLVLGLASIAGVSALGLGIVIWIFGVHLILLHTVFGFTVVLILFGLSLAATATKGIRRLGTLGIVDAIVVAVLGRTQTMILTGHLHWLVQTVHLLLGVSAVHLTGTIAMRLFREKKRSTEPASMPPRGDL